MYQSVWQLTTVMAQATLSVVIEKAEQFGECKSLPNSACLEKCLELWDLSAKKESPGKKTYALSESSPPRSLLFIVAIHQIGCI